MPGFGEHKNSFKKTKIQGWWKSNFVVRIKYLFPTTFKAPQSPERVISSLFPVNYFQCCTVDPHTKFLSKTVHQNIKVWQCDSYWMNSHQICGLEEEVLPLGQLVLHIWLLLIFFLWGYVKDNVYYTLFLNSAKLNRRLTLKVRKITDKLKMCGKTAKLG